MRILFFGEDESMRHMAESLTNVEAVHCTDVKEAQALLKEWDKDRGDELDIFVSVLDLSLGIKELDKFAKKTKKLDGHYRCVFAYTQDLADLKSYQKTKWACDGQLLGPMSLEGLQEIVSDFETVYYLDELDEDEEVELTELESSAAKELENLDEDKEDYDTTESGMVLPDEFQKEGASPSEVSEDTVEDDEDDLTAEVAIFHNNPTHKKIQEVFDHVFKYGKKSNPAQASEDLVLPEDDAEEEVASQSEAKMAEPKDEEIGLEFDLPDDEESLDEEEEVQASDEQKATEKQEDEDDDGLGFELSFDDSEEESSAAPDPAKQDSSKPESEEENGELDELSFGADDEEESSFEESTAELLADDYSPEKEESSSEEGGFEFDAEEDSDENSLDLSSEDYDADAPVEEASKDESSPGDLEFGEGEDEDDGLSFELGGASEAEGASEQEQESSDSPGDLDFDVDQEDELQMSDTESSNGPANEQADESDDFGDLDLSSDSDEDLDATKLAAAPMAQDEVSSTEDEDNTQDKVDQTISQIVRAEASDDLSGQSDEEATGDFDLPDGLPSELTDDMMSEESTDSQDFSVDEWKDDDLEEKPAGEDTNPTVVTSGHDLKEKTQSDTDETPAGFELSDDDEEDFDFAGIEDNSSAEEELDKTVVQERDEIPKEFKVNHPEAPAPKGLSAYAEDELTRLQSTIRQLREERDENHKQIQELKKESRLIEQEGLSEKAELDELKIEISILKKRHKNEVEELRYQLKLADEKKQIYEERCRNYQKEFERLNQKVRIEFNQVKQREKELESQLELVTMDTEAQVQSRDGKILELKRKIDSLEFNMENASIREQKSREDKARLEERLTKIMSTLRGSIQLLEDDNDSIDPSVDGDTDEKI